MVGITSFFQWHSTPGLSRGPSAVRALNNVWFREFGGINHIIQVVTLIYPGASVNLPTKAVWSLMSSAVIEPSRGYHIFIQFGLITTPVSPIEICLFITVDKDRRVKVIPECLAAVVMSLVTNARPNASLKGP